MAEKIVEYKVTVKTDGSASAVDALHQKLQNVVGEQGSVASAAEQSSARQVASHRKVGDGVQSVSAQLASLKTQMLGLVGINIGAQGIKDLVALGDAYKNLEARVKLTTGEGKAFDAAFEGVFDVATRTNSAVAETGLLFTKLNDAGKALGRSQQDALHLTETINQSIQLSGASAEASKAAIVQLVQGLQSGVLRGDEFNSVMEQSPRLAKALADGLGVTIGELRKLAEAGDLTSTKVISALEKQSDAIATEFSQLPLTVGRAMTNLSTEFTRFVGETDAAGGYTTKLAGAVDLLAGNLGTVATVMIHTGQALGAMKLLSMAQDWLAAGAAIKATVPATEQATASTTRHTAAVVANDAAFKNLQWDVARHTAALRENTAAQGTNAAATSGAGRAAATAETQVTAFGSALKFLKGFAVLDIALNFKSYGTAIGEAAAKLMGYKDRTEELARADKLAAEIAQDNIKARRDQAAALKEATDRSFELGKAGNDLVGKFDEMRVKGDSAAEAIGKIGKDFDLATVPGIKTAAAVLDKLQADGKIAAGEFQKAWADALKGQDLAVFETQARAAFSGTAREAERVAQLLDASVREAVRRTGMDMDLISGGMGRAARSAINDTEAIIKGLDRLKAMGVDTGQALAASLTKGIDTADSQRALDVVKTQIEAMRKALGDKVADGLLDQAKQKALELGDALDKAKPGVSSLREAMKELGLRSREDLDATAKKAREAYDQIIKAGQQEGESFVGWQARKQQAATVMLQRMIEANSGVANEAIRTRASMEGLEIQVDGTGRAIVRAMGSGADAAKALGSAVGLTTEQIRAQEDALDRVAMKYKLTADYTERQIALLEREAALMERMDTIERKRQGIDKNGFSTDKSGNTVVAGGDLTTLTGIAAFLKSAGVADDKAARDIAREFADAKGDIPYFSNPGQMKYGGAGSTMSQALLKAAERYTFGSGAAVGRVGATPPPATIPEQTRTVNINLNGASLGTVRTDDAGDATLQRLMDELARSKAAAQG